MPPDRVKVSCPIDVLDQACTQEQFGRLVGVSQPMVSDLLARRVFLPGQTAGQWLLSYTAHMREQAAARGADSKLATMRTRLAEAQSVKVEFQNNVTASEYASVATLDLVLTVVGRAMVGAIEPLHMRLPQLCPGITADGLRLIHDAVSRACDRAANMSLDDLNVIDDPALDEPEDEFPPTDNPEEPP